MVITGAQARYDISNNASINTSGYELRIRERLRHILNSNLIFCLGLCSENKAFTTKALDARCPMSARSSAFDPRRSHSRYALEGNLRLGGTVIQYFQCKGPFTHAIFDAISDAISRAKRALPYPARMLFSRSIVWIGKKVITYCFKTPFIPISANLVVFCRSVTRLKTRAGLAGAGFVRKIAPKSHEKSHV